MVYAVVVDPGAVDSPDVPSYQPHVYGRLDPPALIPLQMREVDLRVDCAAGCATAEVTVRARWWVHCLTRSRDCDCRIVVPMGEQGSILGAEVTVGKRSYNTHVIDVEDHSAVKITKTESGGLIKRHLFSLTIPKVGGGEDIFATIRWSQKLLYDNGQFSVDIPFRFPQYVNPLPQVFMKREKIQLTVNSGVSKEVLLQGTSHPLKEKSRQGEKLSFLHEAVVENWSNKDFTFAYNSTSMPPLLRRHLHRHREGGAGRGSRRREGGGFIAMYATLASRDVDCCLIPESPFYRDGEGGLLQYIERRLKENKHMVIVVAEGAGQDIIAKSIATSDQQDASGNKLLLDIGLWLTHKIKDYFKNKKMEMTIKYIDPTYMIRAIPSNASDNVYCTLLAHSAIHGAMAGYSFTVGMVNGRHTYIPFYRVTSTRNQVKITDRMWARLLSSTNQPSFLSQKDIDDAREADRLANRPPLPTGASHHVANSFDQSASSSSNGEM